MPELTPFQPLHSTLRKLTIQQANQNIIYYSALANFTELHTLRLGSDTEYFLSINNLTSVPNMEMLNMGNSKVKHISTSFFSLLPNLTYFELSFAAIDCLEVVSAA